MNPIATQIADALETAHEQGIVHRVLKPANVKVQPTGTVNEAPTCSFQTRRTFSSSEPSFTWRNP